MSKMFALGFDDLKRKFNKSGIELRPLPNGTCTIGTNQWEQYWHIYNLPESLVDVKVEDDNRTYTFYTIHKINESLEEAPNEH